MLGKAPNHIRISATDLDTFRYFRENDHVNADSFLAQMRRESEQTPQMRAGSALHNALENADSGNFSTLSSGAYSFEITANVTIEIPHMREMKATKTYQIGNITATLVGKVDAINGTTVYDHKLTKAIAPDRYLASYQWRAYLDIFDADCFVWNVFQGIPKSASDLNPHEYVIKNFTQFSTTRYPNMHDDLHAEIASFVDMAKIYLPEKFTTSVC